MSKHATTLMFAVALSFASTGVALADDGGGGGDNSMSMWTGESYAAFNRGAVGDFYTDRYDVAAKDKPLAESQTVLAEPARKITPRSPFRDDTAA